VETVGQKRKNPRDFFVKIASAHGMRFFGTDEGAYIFAKQYIRSTGALRKILTV